MIRPLTAAILGIALGLTPLSVAPARADNTQDIAQILGALAVLGIAGKAYNDYRDRKEEESRPEVTRSTRTYTAPEYRTDRHTGRHSDRHSGRHGDGARRGGQGSRHMRDRTLPAACSVGLSSRHGPSRVYGKNCLDRSGVRTERLPRGCETWVQVGGRWRTAYGAHCLQARGWREARHRD